jgi:hypothetical protein
LPGRFVNGAVGYSLSYPDGWVVRGQVVATEFASGAECDSVVVVDFEPPGSAGPGGNTIRSFVQACARALVDDRTLEDFMRRTYGQDFPSKFRSTTRGSLPAFEDATAESDRTIFLQTTDHRLQIRTSVVAAPNMLSTRLSQVRWILDSFSVVQEVGKDGQATL